jgi:secreted trypsin-like serine protease
MLFNFTSPAWAFLTLTGPQHAYELTVLVKNNNQDCTGILLNSATVLTAAHCVYAQNRNQIKVYFHVAKSNGELASSVAQRIITHPQYKDITKADYDLALIKLEQPAPSVLISKLNTASFDFQLKKNITTNSIGLLFGYGIKPWLESKIKFGVKKYNLQNKNLQISNDRYFSLNNFTAQACHGDSGGPLFEVDQNNNMLLIGIAIGVNAIKQPLNVKIENAPISQDFKNCSGIVYFHKLKPIYTWLTENLTAQ